jgi:protein-tyrosine phosphatase
MGRKLSHDVDAHLVCGTLYQGSYPCPVPSIRDNVDTLAFTAIEYQPRHWWRAIRVIRARLHDDDMPMERRERRQALLAAEKVRDRLDKGDRVLVTCYAGLNRSGLVCALALMAPTLEPSKTPGNFSAHDAIKAVRRARGPLALSNDYFVSFLENMNALRSSCGPGW